jgi:ApbE superfamily uncharacterized protein (UPF0280 family)
MQAKDARVIRMMDIGREPRNYRKIFKGEDLIYFNVKVKQTDLYIGASDNLYKQARESVIKYRRQVEDYIRRQPVFLHSLSPVKPLDNAPEIVQHMCRAAEDAAVGPMAAVAGAFSFYVANDLAPFSKELVIENGGDIYITGTRERIVSVFAGKSPLSGKIGLSIAPELLPLSVCTSSGTVGHSLSFGKADAVVIVSKDACLADAMATSIGNMVKTEEDIQKALKRVQNKQGVLGTLIIVGEKMGAWGKIRLVKL